MRAIGTQHVEGFVRRYKARGANAKCVRERAIVSICAMACGYVLFK